MYRTSAVVPVQTSRRDEQRCHALCYETMRLRNGSKMVPHCTDHADQKYVAILDSNDRMQGTLFARCFSALVDASNATRIAQAPGTLTGRRDNNDHAPRCANGRNE